MENEMNYKVKIENGILKANIDGRHYIWMCRAPRRAPVETKSGLYVLTDDMGYCCYVGESDNFKTRMSAHESEDKFCWWSTSVFFWDESPSGAFDSTDDRRWYEKNLKKILEAKHPTFTKKVYNKPKPNSGDEVLKELLSLLDMIGFETVQSDEETESGGQVPAAERATRRTQPMSPRPTSRNSASRQEPTPHKNHRPPLGAWPNYTTLARAIAERRGRPGAAGGIQQKLTNFWIPGRRQYAHANQQTRTMLEGLGVEFDETGFVKSCAAVPFPLP